MLRHEYLLPHMLGGVTLAVLFSAASVHPQTTDETAGLSSGALAGAVVSCSAQEADAAATAVTERGSVPTAPRHRAVEGQPSKTGVKE